MSGHRAVTLDNIVYSTGRWLCYTKLGLSWDKLNLAKPTFARAELGYKYNSPYCVLIGGYDAEYLDDIWQWDKDKQAWIETAKMVNTRGFHAVSVFTTDNSVMDYCG